MFSHSLLQAQFALLVPPSSLLLPDKSFEEIHDELVNKILLDAHLNEYPPSKEYQLSFWKWAVKRLETLAINKDVELDSRLYETLISLMTSSSSNNSGIPKPPIPSYVTYYWPQQDDPGALLQKATLLESRTMIEQGTTGLKTWPAAMALAEYLLGLPEIINNARVLELGSGAGFLGVILAAIQLQSDKKRCGLWLSDLNDEVLSRCNDNIHLPCNFSSLHPNIHCSNLDWSAAVNTEETPALVSLLKEIDLDVVLGADIVYDPSIIPPLIAVLQLALSPVPGKESKFAVLALTVRNWKTHSQFLDAARAAFEVSHLSSVNSRSRFFYKGSQDPQEIQIIQLKPK